MARTQFKKLVEDFSGPIQVAQFTAASDTTALVPGAGNRLEIYKIIVDAPDAQPNDTVRFTDG